MLAGLVLPWVVLAVGAAVSCLAARRQPERFFFPRVASVGLALIALLAVPDLVSL